MEKIIYIRGLWSHPKAIEWITNNLSEKTDLPVEIFDYHDILTEKISNTEFLKRILEKYGDFYGSYDDKIILIGHSLGGTLSTVLAENFTANSLILTNPAIKPWGILRRVPNQFKYLTGRLGLTEGYHPHFFVKYDGEIKERTDYFTKNFKLGRDLSRVLYTSKEALNSLNNLKSRLLLIQSMQDEFVSVSANINFYNKCDLGEKEIELIPKGEHAILEEGDIYLQIYNKLANFIKK